MAKRLTRYLSLLWDRAAATRMQQEAEEALAKTGAGAGEEFEKAMKEGGRKAGRALTLALEREYKVRLGRARQQLAEGLINEGDFEREGREAAQAFNRGLTGGIRRLQTQRNATDLELANLAGRMKTVRGSAGARVGGMFAGLSGLGIGGLGGAIGVGAATAEIRESIGAADRLDASVRKLGATAQIANVPLEELQALAARAKEEFNLGSVAANDLAGGVAKLAERTGDASQMGTVMVAWLDLMAANGISAAESGEQLTNILSGQDEALNRLGLANPSQLYEKWAEQIGTTASKLSDQQKMQAIVNEIVRAGTAVQGEHAKAMDTSAGKAQQHAQAMEDLRAEIGRAAQPIREVGGFLQEFLLANLKAITVVVGGFISGWQKLVEFARQPLNFKIQVIKSALGFEGDGAPMLSESQAQLDARDATWAAVQTGTARDALGNLYRTPAQRAEQSRVEAAREAAARAEAAETARKEAERAAEAQAKRMAAEAEKVRKAALARMGDTPGGLLAGGDAALHAERTRRERDRAAFEAQGGSLAPVGVGGREILPIDQVGRFEDAYLDMLDNVGAVSDRIAGEIANAFAFTFELMKEEGATVGNFLEGVLRGIGAAGLAGLAEFAHGKVRENIAAAIQAGAEALGFGSHGNFASASAAWASAAQHAAAAVAWGAVAGGAGFAGRAMTSMGGGGRDAGLDRAESAERMGMEFHLHVDGLNPSNPDHQRRTYAAMEYARERFGADTRVIYHAGGG